ncbi:TetR/AcrR family transcriptional regulator [Sphaerisporangium album]|uniref:TetR/AcrR family transcriptional regulator n=1 Tax=Sphaerisporangium album TaxID=509200 RepID=A0A367FMX7_9ACTN|nr:TetR/AcrR family transcriptional regulator [Sphaerisporangium album]RCG31621.1 TetR/AcrR family transcriptional regulator [Sphaerisporangium album]
MPQVKGRNKRSAQTRRRVVEAAHALFVVRGYAGTTFQEIADAAGVSVQTVYFHYGSKSGLLKEVIDVASVGDDAPVALLDRTGFTGLQMLEDPEAVVRGWVRESAVILDRVAPLLAVVRDAAGSDPDMAAQWATNSEQRRTAHEAFVAIIARLRALRPGLTRRRAADITVGLLSPELFLIMTRESGWTTAQWQTWAADHLAHDLLRRP